MTVTAPQRPPTATYAIRSKRCTSPAWSPNGKQIAFSRTIPGGISLMNADGRHVVLLKATAGNQCGITWNRDPTNG